MVHFVGAGSGAADLITVRGARLLGEADQIIYAGSLVNPELLEYRKKGCLVHDSAGMTLEQVIGKIKEAEDKGMETVRLVSYTHLDVYKRQMDIGEQKEPVIPAAGEIMKREVMPIRARALIRMTESGGSTC